MRTIENEKPTQSPVEAPASSASVVRLDKRRRWVRRVAAGVGAACVAAAALIFVVGNDGLGGPDPSPVVAAGPQFRLQQVALAAEKDGPAGTGPIRHLRFVNLTDVDRPTYDAYVRPDGTALFGVAGGDLKETSGYLTSAQLTSLPVDPYQLRTRMLSLSSERGLGYPGEAPDRALYRLATQLVPDPEVAPEVKAGIYRVLAGLNLEAIRARDLGAGADPTGRPGDVLEFTFEEGYVDRLVIDSATGALLSTETANREGKLAGGQVYVSAEMVDRTPLTHA